MPKVAALGLALTVLLVPLPAAAACSVLLDVSGSMNGFRTAGQFAPYSQLLDRFQHICNTGYIFGDPDPRRPGAENGPFLVRTGTALNLEPTNNRTTFLGSAVSKWFERADEETTAIIVTDNVADESAASQLEQNIFTDAITSPQVTGLTMIPAILPFSGLVYDPTRKVHSHFYDGSRALAIYVVHRGPAEDFDGVVQQVVSATASAVDNDSRKYQVIQIRPLFAYSAPDATVSNVATDDRSISAELVPNGIHILPHPLDRSWTMTVDVALRAPKEWEARSTVTAEMDVDPLLAQDLTVSKMSASVKPGGAVHFKDGEPVPIQVVVPIGAMDYKSDAKLGPILSRLLSGDTAVRTTGQLVIHVAFKAADINLNPEVVRKWDFCGNPMRLAEPTDAVQSKIYCMAPVVEKIVNASVRYEKPHKLGISSDARLPMWPLYGFVGGLLALAVAVLAFLFYAGRRREFEVTNDVGETQRSAISFGAALMLVSQDGKITARARRLVAFFLITSRCRMVRGRLLWGDRGGAIRLSDARKTRSIESATKLLGRAKPRGEEELSNEPDFQHDATYDFRIAARAKTGKDTNIEDPNHVL